MMRRFRINFSESHLPEVVASYASSTYKPIHIEFPPTTFPSILGALGHRLNLPSDFVLSTFADLSAFWREKAPSRNR
jgi:hypothetical protein